MFVEIKSNVEGFFLQGRVPFIVDSVGSSVPQTEIVRPRGFGSHHILWLTEGEGNFTLNGEKLLLRAGEGVFIRSEVPHSAASGDSFNTRWITFFGLDGLLDFYGVKDYFTFNVTEQLTNSFKSLYRHATGQSTVLSRSSLGYQIVTEFLDSTFAPSAPLSAKVDRFLEANFKENLSLQDIADEMGMNKYTLCKRYSELCGMTVIKRFKKIRVEKAKQYLLSTPYSAERVGEMCGFMSPSYFGKIFKEITGMTPKEYRLKHK